MMMTDQLITEDDHRGWSQRMITEDDHRRWSQTMITDDDHRRWSQTMITDDDHRRWSQTMITDDDHRRWSQTMITDDNHRRWSQTMIRRWSQTMITSNDQLIQSIPAVITNVDHEEWSSTPGSRPMITEVYHKPSSETSIVSNDHDDHHAQWSQRVTCDQPRLGSILFGTCVMWWALSEHWRIYEIIFKMNLWSNLWPLPFNPWNDVTGRLPLWIDPLNELFIRPVAPSFHFRFRRHGINIRFRFRSNVQNRFTASIDISSKPPRRPVLQILIPFELARCGILPGARVTCLGLTSGGMSGIGDGTSVGITRSHDYLARLQSNMSSELQYISFLDVQTFLWTSVEL